MFTNELSLGSGRKKIGIATGMVFHLSVGLICNIILDRYLMKRRARSSVYISRKQVVALNDAQPQRTHART